MGTSLVAVIEWVIMGNHRQPWEKRKWQNGVIRPDRSVVFVLGLVGLLFAGVGAALVAKHNFAFSWPPNKNMLVLLFPVIGLYILFVALTAALRQWKFRGTLFRMETMPGVIGGKLRGVLVVPRVQGNDWQMTISLINQEKKTSGSGKNRHTSVHVLFKQQKIVNTADYFRSTPTITGSGYIEIPVEFVIPYDTKDQTDNYDRHSYCWLLEVKADIPGLDMNFTFDMPVFRTEQSRMELTRDSMETEAAQEALSDIKQDVRRLREISIILKEGHEHYCSRSKGWILFMIGVFLLAIGAGLIGHGLAATSDNPNGTMKIVYSAFSAPVLVGFGILCVGGFIFLVGLFTMGRREVYVSCGAIHYCRRLALLDFRKQIERELITDITVEKSGSVNGKNFYDVRVGHGNLDQVSIWERFFGSKAPSEKRSNIPLAVAAGITDKAEAMWLADRLKEQLRI